MPGNSVGMGFLIYNYLNTEEAICFFCIYQVFITCKDKYICYNKLVK